MRENVDRINSRALKAIDEAIVRLLVTNCQIKSLKCKETNICTVDIIEAKIF